MADQALYVPGRPVVYAGSERDLDLPFTTITDPLPRGIAGLQPSHWVIVDPWTFPFDHLSADQRDVPMDIVMQEPRSVPGYVQTMTNALKLHIGPYDSLTCEMAVWDRMSRSMPLTFSQWNRPQVSELASIKTLLRNARVSQVVSEELPADQARNTGIRTKTNKARYNAEAAVIAPLMERTADQLPPGTGRHSIEVGEDIGQYRGLLRDASFDVRSFRMATDHASRLRFDEPDLDLMIVGQQGATTQPPESVDLLISSIDFLQWPAGLFQTLLRRLLKTLRIGATMIHVHRTRPGGPSLSDFIALISAVGGQQIIRQSVTTLANPVSGFTDTAVLSLTKIGAPQTW